MVCSTYLSLILAQPRLHLHHPLFSHMIHFQGYSYCLLEDIPHKAPTSRFKEPLMLPEEYTIISRNFCCHNLEVRDNHFNRVVNQGQVNFSFFFNSCSRHSDFLHYASDVIQISLKIALQTLNLHIYAMNLLTSEPRT